MKQKTLLILCAVFALLIGITLIKKSLAPDVPSIEEWSKIVKHPINLSEMSDVTISLGAKKIHFTKEKKAWTVKSQFGAPADDQKLASLVVKINKLEGELRSDDKDLLGDYGIKDTDALHIKFKKVSLELAHLVIGTKKAGWKKNFIRHNSSNAVYVVDENILSELGFHNDIKEENFNTDQWVNKKIVYVDSSKIHTVNLQINSQAQLSFKKALKDEQSSWLPEINYAYKFDQSKINNFIQSIENLRANSIVELKSDNFDKSDWKLSLGLGEGQRMTLIRGKKEDGSYYLKDLDKSYAYKVSEYTLNSLDKTDGDFFITNPLGFDEKGIKQISLKDVSTKTNVVFSKIAIKKNNDEDKISQDNTDVQWVSDKKDEYQKEDVQNLLQKLKSLTLHTVSKITQSVENDIILKIMKEDSAKEYTFTKSVPLNGGRECHYLTIEGELQNFCINNNQVTGLKDSISKLEENKKKVGKEKPKAESSVPIVEKNQIINEVAVPEVTPDLKEQMP